MSNVVKGVGAALGFGGESSVKQAGGEQLAATKEQIKYLQGAENRATERLSPFVKLGTDNIAGFQALLDPQNQAAYLQNNPLFQAAIQNTGRQLGASSAAQGKLGSGGLVDQLMQNYLSQGENYITNQFNRLLTPVQIGQASAAGSAANTLNSASQVGNAIGQMGDIRAATILGRQNASAALGNNLLGGIGGGLMGSGLLGGAGIAGGGLGGGAIGALFGLSDRKYKRDIIKTGEDENGNVYRFKYLWSDDVYEGRMADELRTVRPDAVVELDGALLVSDEFMPRKVA